MKSRILLFLILILFTSCGGGTLGTGIKPNGANMLIGEPNSFTTPGLMEDCGNLEGELRRKCEEGK